MRRPPSDQLAVAENDLHFLDEDSFQAMITFERKRSERSTRACALVLVAAYDGSAPRAILLEKIATALATETRDTDMTGWYKHDSVVGVIFTDIAAHQKSAIIRSILARVNDTLRRNLSPAQLNQISVSMSCYPEDWQLELSRRPSDPALYPDLAKRDRSRRVAIVVKRIMDIVGGAAALVLLSPVLLAAAVAIKLTSKGPVFFRQQRVGRHGRAFVMLKFRSMHMNNDTRVHEQWFQNFYTGKAKRHPTDGNGNGSYKPPHDPRVTAVGRLLRRTSLDEVPQFINVLKGEMSLVGPRPPIPYEVDVYQAWHRGRVLQAKPGITGLWQVQGRSRVPFDEMVRLDLRYARTWSIWLDIKILLKTPAAIFSGEGAY